MNPITAALAADGWIAFHDYGRFAVAEGAERLQRRWRTQPKIIDFLAVTY